MPDIGAQRSWNRLIDGRCGIVSLRDKGAEFQQQKCQVAGLVPKGRKEDGGWNVDDWLDRTVLLCPDKIYITTIAKDIDI